MKRRGSIETITDISMSTVVIVVLILIALALLVANEGQMFGV